MLQSKIQSISQKGQVVIPKIYRESLGLTPYSKFIIEIAPNTTDLILRPISNPIENLCGILSGKVQNIKTIKKNLQKEEQKYEKKYHRVRS